MKKFTCQRKRGIHKRKTDERKKIDTHRDNVYKEERREREGGEREREDL